MQANSLKEAMRVAVNHPIDCAEGVELQLRAVWYHADGGGVLSVAWADVDSYRGHYGVPDAVGIYYRDGDEPQYLLVDCRHLQLAVQVVQRLLAHHPSWDFV